MSSSDTYTALHKKVHQRRLHHGYRISKLIYNVNFFLLVQEYSSAIEISPFEQQKWRLSYTQISSPLTQMTLNNVKEKCKVQLKMVSDW